VAQEPGAQRRFSAITEQALWKQQRHDTAGANSTDKTLNKQNRNRKAPQSVQLAGGQGLDLTLLVQPPGLKTARKKLQVLWVKVSDTSPPIGRIAKSSSKSALKRRLFEQTISATKVRALWSRKHIRINIKAEQILCRRDPALNKSSTQERAISTRWIKDWSLLWGRQAEQLEITPHLPQQRNRYLVGCKELSSGLANSPAVLWVVSAHTVSLAANLGFL